MPETFRQDTKRYETWLARYCDLDKAGLKKKRKAMRESAFALLRGSFYRWPACWAGLEAPVREAPAILCVGDLHLENFGTWRDDEGRLAWGVNDFDEAAPLPFTSDLVRLATSVRLTAGKALRASERAAVEHLLCGYRVRLEDGPRPFILEERHGWLRDIANVDGAAAEQYWDKLLEDDTVNAKQLPSAALAALRQALPKDAANVIYRRRRSGLGSLGRPRFTAIADWNGGRLAREAKALAPSAARMPQRVRGDVARDSRRILKTAYRAADPFLHLRPGWIVRRLSPGSRKIELDEISHAADVRRLLEAMGAELANIHIGTAGSAKPLRRYLDTLASGWLQHASEQAERRVREDYARFAGD